MLISHCYLKRRYCGDYHPPFQGRLQLLRKASGKNHRLLGQADFDDRHVKAVCMLLQASLSVSVNMLEPNNGQSVSPKANRLLVPKGSQARYTGELLLRTRPKTYRATRPASITRPAALTRFIATQLATSQAAAATRPPVRVPSLAIPPAKTTTRPSVRVRSPPTVMAPTTRPSVLMRSLATQPAADFPVLQGVGADWPYTLNLRVPSESMAKEIDFGSTHQAPGLSRLSDKSLSLCTSYRFFRQPIGFGHFENAIGYAKFYSRSHDAVIRVYDEADNVIETHEHKGDFKD